MVFGEEFSLRTRGFSDIVNITDKVQEIVTRSKITRGTATISVIGSTASVSTIEYEPALVADFKDQLERLAPKDMRTRHAETWGDDNGFSHIRSTLMGPSATIPITDGKLILGTWQQLIVVDHDNRARSRRLFAQVVGE